MFTAALVGLSTHVAPAGAWPAAFRRCGKAPTVVSEFTPAYDFDARSFPPPDPALSGYLLESAVDPAEEEAYREFYLQERQSPGAREPVLHNTLTLVHGERRMTVAVATGAYDRRLTERPQRVTPKSPAKLGLVRSYMGSYSAWVPYGPFDLDGDELPEWIIGYSLCSSGHEEDPIGSFRFVSLRADGLVLLSEEFSGWVDCGASNDIGLHADGTKLALVTDSGGTRLRWRIEGGSFCQETLVHRALDEARKAKPLATLPSGVPPFRKSANDDESFPSVSTRLDLGGGPELEQVTCGWTGTNEYHFFMCRVADADGPIQFSAHLYRPRPRAIRLLPSMHDGYHDLLVNDDELLRATCSEGSCRYEPFVFGEVLDAPTP